MMVIGCDYHPSWRQVCWMDTLTGKTGEQKLDHASGEAERFYRVVARTALIGMESTGNCQWFVELLTTLEHEVWIGDGTYSPPRPSVSRPPAWSTPESEHPGRDPWEQVTT